MGGFSIFQLCMSICQESIGIHRNQSFIRRGHVWYRGSLEPGTFGPGFAGRRVMASQTGHDEKTWEGLKQTGDEMEKVLFFVME